MENLLEAEPEKGGKAPTRTAAQRKDAPRKAREIIADAIGEPDADGWESLGSVGQRTQGTHPDFDPRSYGCANLSTLVERSGGFDIRKDSDKVHVRRKAATRKGSGTAQVPTV